MMKVIRGHISPETAIVAEVGGKQFRYWLARTGKGFQLATSRSASTGKGEKWNPPKYTEPACWAVMLQSPKGDITWTCLDYKSWPSVVKRLLDGPIPAQLTSDERAGLMAIVDKSRRDNAESWASLEPVTPPADLTPVSLTQNELDRLIDSMF